MHIGHSHDHHHEEHHGFESVAQAVSVMTYMLDHNRHHAEELHDLSHRLDAMGKHEAAHQLHHALEDYNKGNDALEKALASLKEEN